MSGLRRWDEWTRGGKRPHLFTIHGEAPFSIAGISDAGDISRCCLLTTSANSVLKPIHDRMPAIVLVILFGVQELVSYTHSQ